MGYLWVDELTVDPALVVPKRWDAATTAEALAAARERLAAHDAVTWEADELEPPLRELVEARGWKAGDLFMAIRVAITGRTATPPLFDTLVALGPRADARPHRRRDRAARRRPAPERGSGRPPEMNESLTPAADVDPAMNTSLTPARHDPECMGRTILVVDDETTLRETLVEALELEGYRAIPAADGRQALALFRAERPDLVLLDLMLPELSGVEVCRIIRAESGVPIIMLTAKDAEVDKVVGLELGADDYVTKPFSLRELTARIRAIFRRAEQAVAADMPPLVDLGRVQVDVGGHRVLRDGDAVPLKPKAFDLLAFLLRHPGQVFTRDQLLEHVWGYDYGGESRTVDVHIHWLRSEIEEDPATPEFLHTVRGVGYVFRRPG